MTRFAAAIALFAACTAVFAAGLPGPDGRPVVLRGIGWSPWHKTEHWALSDATKALDRKLLRAAHINTLRNWGPDSPAYIAANLKQGFMTIPTIQCSKGLPAEFSSGTKQGIALGDPATREAFARRVEAYARQFVGTKGAPCFLLGNEYSGVGQDPARGGYFYKGFEAPTQARFRAWLKARFGTVAALNYVCGTTFASFDDVKPLATRRLRYEFWLFQNRDFETFMRAAHDAFRRGAPDQRTSYAKLMGTHWDPYTEDARLSFLEVGGDNLYWHWVHDWAKYDAFLDDLIAAAEGKPVIITEGGFQTRIDGPEKSARLMKQMLWNAFLHPEVAGVCVFEYSDEWYTDGNPATQSPGESWGIVTADRHPKPDYHALAQVYAAVEALNDFLVGCKAPPVVDVSNQALGYLVEDDSIALHYEIGRVLYSEGVPFASAMPADLYHLDPTRVPRLILCDDMLDCSPDGSHSAAQAVVRYVRDGGQVLYLCSKPWRQPYGGEAKVPAALRFGAQKGETGAVSGPRRVRYGKGEVIFVPRQDFTPEQLRGLVTGFLAETGAPRAVRVSGVDPRERRADVFCRLLTKGDRRLLVVVDSGDAPLGEVDLDVADASAAKVLFSDGAEAAPVVKAAGARSDRLHLVLRNLNTYAVVEVK